MAGNGWAERGGSPLRNILMILAANRPRGGQEQHIHCIYSEKNVGKREKSTIAASFNLKRYVTSSETVDYTT